MLDPEKIAEVEQSIAMIGELLPASWRILYENLIKKGFTECESFKLVQTYILSQCPNGVRGDDG